MAMSFQQERPLPMAVSESKGSFYKRLGLGESDKGHRRLYLMMKDEAGEGWHRLTGDPESYAAAVRNVPNVDPARITFASIDEKAMRREVARIYHDSSTATRIIYNLAHEPGNEGQNWIIRWFVWHVFRYRDERNGARNRRNAENSTEPESTESSVEPGIESVTDEDALKAARDWEEQRTSHQPEQSQKAAQSADPRVFYDAVRDQWQNP